MSARRGVSHTAPARPYLQCGRQRRGGWVEDVAAKQLQHNSSSSSHHSPQAQSLGYTQTSDVPDRTHADVAAGACGVVAGIESGVSGVGEGGAQQLQKARSNSSIAGAAHKLHGVSTWCNVTLSTGTAIAAGVCGGAGCAGAKR
jgi:hypothetical protein